MDNAPTALALPIVMMSSYNWERSIDARVAPTSAPKARFAKMDSAPTAWAEPIVETKSSISAMISITARVAPTSAPMARFAKMDNASLELATPIAGEK